MNSIKSFAIGILIASSCAESIKAVTVPGMVADGRPSLYYVALTGEFGFQPDGKPIGLFDIQSAFGILMSNANLPAGGLGFDVNTANRISWAALPANAFVTNLSLGLVAPPSLSLDFLLNDLTLVFSGGFGTPHVIPDLVYTIPEPATGSLCGLVLLTFVGCRHSRRRSAHRLITKAQKVGNSPVEAM